MPDKDPRTELRTPRTEAVLLTSLDPPSVHESTRTQNISPSGARVFTQRIWQPGTRIEISSLRGDFWAQAKIVYWRSFASSTFAIGLEFHARKGEWPAQN
jgi:hypothetical protein